MIKSINAWAFDSARPLTEVFNLARSSGFDGVEVTIGEEGEVTPATTESECRIIRDAAKAAGIQIVGLASGLGWTYPLTSTNAETAKKAVEFTKRSLQVARWLGTDALLVVPGGVGADFIPGFDGAPYDVAYENLTKALESLKATAKSEQVSIGIENVWNMFLLSPLEMRDLIDNAKSEYVGSYFDVGNVVATGYPEQWVKILGSRIKRVHLKDFKRSVATLDGFCPLLEGDTDYPAVMSALRETGYDGPVTAEFFGVEEQLPAIAAAIDKILAL